MPDHSAPRGFYEGLAARSLMAGWARREQPAGSKSDMRVHVWRATEARAALQEASRFVGDRRGRAAQPHYGKPGTGQYLCHDP